MKRSSGFTLVELLVVIAIIGMLVGLLLPAVQQARAAARNMQCKNNIRQISMAMLGYESEHQTFPPGTHVYIDSTTPVDWERRTWFWTTLPYLEQMALFDPIQAHYFAEKRTGSYDYTNLPNKEVPVPVFMCPDDPLRPKIHNGSSTSNQQGFHGNYMGNGGNSYFNSGGYKESANLNGIFPAVEGIKMDSISDGKSYTLFFSEILLVPDGDVGSGREDIRGRYHNGRHAGVLFSTLYQPNTGQPDRHNYSISTDYAPSTSSGTNVIVSARSNHAGGVNASTCDGAVRFVLNSVDLEVWHSAGSRNGAEVKRQLD
ncbi:MAG: DUF1559 domain-containing protein [Planctomycetia bacterium]|nr:DUF1559 domain-containing protein [Planctomycetia bacterium]